MFGWPAPQHEMKTMTNALSGSLRWAAISTLVLMVATLAQAAPKKVLVVTVTKGFRHSSIETAEKVLAELGEKSGAFTVDYARVEPNDPQYKGTDGKPDGAKLDAAIKAVLAEKMSPAALQNYDAVIFANTTGDLPLPDKEAFLEWIKSGKGFVGMHAAGDTFHGFPGFIDMLGAEFKMHDRQVEVHCINQDKRFPACRGLPQDWVVYDEIYQFKISSARKFTGCSAWTSSMTSPVITRSRGARNMAKGGCSTHRWAIAKTCGTRTHNPVRSG